MNNTTMFDPSLEAKIERYHRGEERGILEGEACRPPMLAADSPVIRDELQFDLTAALMQGVA